MSYTSTPARRATLSRQDIVKQAEHLIRERGNDAVSIAHLSALVGVSERGLRNAFYSVRGMSPKRAVMNERLAEVHRALMQARSDGMRVTDIATEHGFFELGRFAGRYKSVFGELPSATLRTHCTVS
jgi:AraC family ethanolamine operon transcriptional activator